MDPGGRGSRPPSNFDNFNGGGDVSSESTRDARRVTVKLYHDRSRPSTLFVPIGQP